MQRSLILGGWSKGTACFPPSTFLTVCRVAVSAMKILRAGYWLWILA